MDSKTPSARRFPVFFLILMVGYALLTARAAGQEKTKLVDVKIAGNVRVEEDGIRLHVKSRAGEFFDASLVEQDVKAIYRMGFFDDVQAALTPEGVLTYTVKEKPYVREVKVQGVSQIGREKIDTAFGVTPRTILDRNKVAEGVEKVRKLYVEQGYVNAKVDYAISVESNNQAVVTLDVVEGNRLLIKKISFEGNRVFSESELKGLMSTKEEWLLSFITNRGVLDRDVLTNDIAILNNHYYDHGYIDHKIDEPVILRRRDGLELVIRVHEGPQYRVGKVEIGGDLIEDGEKMLQRVKITPGQIFRGSRLREDVTALGDLYSNKGFAFAQIEPVTRIQSEEKVVDVALVITKGPPVYFNRILVAGNTKTRDKVVRRELLAAEQELFSGTKLTQSRNALQRSGYFEDVQLTTKKTDQPDAVDLLVDVKEGPTGTFSVGAGYSSGDGFLFNAGIAEKNLFGRGQSVNGSFSIGTSRQDFVVSFNEPYFRDTRLALGFDAFNTEREFESFDQRRLGFGVHTSYPLKDFRVPFWGRPAPDLLRGSDELASNAPPTIWDYMRGGMSYELTREKINGIEAGAPLAIQNERGTSLTSAMAPSLTYDSRDHFFNPTEGTKSAFSVKFAGLGGDNRFIKSDLSGRWHYPLLKDPNWGGAYVLALGGSVGYGFGLTERSNGKKDLPLFERYFLGGINSVRGFADRSLGPRERTCSNVDGVESCATDVVGGDKAAVFNAELMFPIMEQFGLRGVAFFDMGQAFRESDNFSFGDFRRSVGVGARWLSPFGPLRVELGFPLNKKSGDDTSVLGFSIGSQP
ncbi:MAG TPA: outer membrane protein assembly factor BamA [candidate division Zixibacteria bacterium]|nr:outer membrane protein assembly factor BamA [candidate division Zixibacteria bacterium]